MNPLAYLKLGALIVVLLGAAWIGTRIYQAGKNSVLVEINRANDASRSAADKAEGDVLNCSPGKWDKETSTCGK